jgi:hypothetical protein
MTAGSRADPFAPPSSVGHWDPPFPTNHRSPHVVPVLHQYGVRWTVSYRDTTNRDETTNGDRMGRRERASAFAPPGVDVQRIFSRGTSFDLTSLMSPAKASGLARVREPVKDQRTEVPSCVDADGRYGIHCAREVVRLDGVEVLDRGKVVPRRRARCPREWSRSESSAAMP